MRITTYTTRIKDNLNVLVKERAFNYKTENSHLDSAEKIAKMMCDVFELHLLDHIIIGREDEKETYHECI